MTISSAIPTSSASCASSAGSAPPPMTAGCLRVPSSSGSSRRVSRVRSRLRQTRATTVVSQPEGLPTSEVSARSARSQAS
ncbi:hypothetical protein BZZ08_06685 [Streptomyces sp. MH60]|nr:hypothetical protein BZZ08_06685 [Streptomyces sp. MH60]